MKTVDKYQFNEDQPKFDSGIECFLAYHTVLKKYFTLKRICLGGDADQSLYNYLIKEVSILKKVNHESIYRCHKMLKTKNNLYLIYDNIEGDSLQKLLQHKMTFDAKLALVKQIASVLQQIRKNNLAHLAINTNNIVVQAQNKIKVINFGQTVQFGSDQQFLQFSETLKTTLTLYVAPQIFQGKAHVNTDIYSFGVIINKMFQKEFDNQKGTEKTKNRNQSNQGKWIEKLRKMVGRMTIKIPEVRINIKQVCASLEKGPQNEEKDEQNKSFKSTKSERLIGQHNVPPKSALTKNVSNLIASKRDVRAHSQKSNNSSNDSQKNISNSKQALKNKYQQRINQIQTLIKKILKRRNFAMALLYMAKACSHNIQAKSYTSIVLSFLLVKKAAISISQLAKLLKLGKCADLTIQKKIQQYFYKTNFFLRMSPIINKQMISTQQKLQEITAEVMKLDLFASNSLLTEQVKHERMNNSYLRKCVFQFLNSLSLQNTEDYCKNYDLNNIIGVYLISLLSTFKTYEQAYETLFSDNNTKFEDDPFIKSLIEFKKQTIFQLMEMDLQLKEGGKDEDNISITKSARTIK